MRPKLVVVGIAVALAAPAVTDAREDGCLAPQAQRLPDEEEPGRTHRFFPGRDAYPPNLASPHRITNSVALLGVSAVGIDDSGGGRVALRLGGRFGLVRYCPRSRADRDWQLGITAGFYGQFDNSHSQDNIGWDGFYGLLLTHRLSPRHVVKLGMQHTSAHIGDELQERTGRQRLGYTREEVQAGWSWQWAASWRSYVEAGFDYHRSNSELQQPLRAETGVVFEAPERFGGGSWGWYAGIDLSGWQERDWRLDWAAQAGLVWPRSQRVWRLALELVDGRPPMGEFFQDTESWAGIGLWLDL